MSYRHLYKKYEKKYRKLLLCYKKLKCSSGYTALEINSVPTANFPAGSTIDFQLTDGVNPVTPDSVTVVGNVVTVEVPVGSILDPDAEAFLTAASITDATITSAVDTLVKDLKDSNIWIKMKAIYPYVGGTATTHKWNLKDPRDLDVAFRLVFYGGWTHDSNGITGNGTNTNADTFIIPNVDFTTTNGAFGCYIRNPQKTGNTYEMGANSAGFGIALYGATQFYAMFGHGFTVVSNANYGGFYATNRANTNTEGYRNATRVINAAGTPVLPTVKFAIGAFQTVAGGSPSNSNRAFDFISDTLTQQEMGVLYSVIQAFQTTLGRQV
jgi:hypothetical protein